MAAARPRSWVGNQLEAMRLLPGKEGASAAPTARRSANSMATAAPPAKKPTVPVKKVNSDHRKMLKK